MNAVAGLRLNTAKVCKDLFFFFTPSFVGCNFSIKMERFFFFFLFFYIIKTFHFKSVDFLDPLHIHSWNSFMYITYISGDLIVLFGPLFCLCRTSLYPQSSKPFKWVCKLCILICIYLFPGFMLPSQWKQWPESLCFQVVCHILMNGISRWNLEVLWIWRKYSLGLKDKLIRVWWLRVGAAVTSHYSHSHDHNISRMLNPLTHSLFKPPRITSRDLKRYIFMIQGSFLQIFKTIYFIV